MNWTLLTAAVFGLAAAFGWGFAAYLHEKLRRARATIDFLQRDNASLRRLAGRLGGRRG